MHDSKPGVASEFEALPRIAREAIRAHLESRDSAADVAATGALERMAPVFVTLWKRGKLRGCIGELEAQHSNLVAETVDRAVAAATADPRFEALSRAELDQVTIDVTVLGPLEPVESADELDPSRYGLTLRDAVGRRGVLLPAIEGVDTVGEQIEIVRRKAGIEPDSPVTMWRFTAEKVTEK